jgi:hypothetical protein
VQAAALASFIQVDFLIHATNTPADTTNEAQFDPLHSIGHVHANVALGVTFF